MDNNDARHQVWEEPDSPRVREFRLSVQSLLRGGERDNQRDIMELAGEALEGLPERMSKAWAVDVIREIFGTFGLEFQRAQYDEVATPRWSMIEPSIVEEDEGTERESDSEEEEAEEAEEEEEEEEKNEELAPVAETPGEEPTKEVEAPVVPSETSGQPAKPEVDDSSEVGDSASWETPLQTPPDSDDEGCCIPSLKRLSRQTQPHTLTPPVSPPSTFSKPAVVTDSEKEPDPSFTPSRSSQPSSPKRNSLIQSIRKRLSKTSIKFRITRRIRAIASGTPLPPKAKEKRRRPTSRTSTEDIQTVLDGPVLKLNRMSDMSLPLTAAERKEMERRRAHESKLTEDFDLVLRLGTLRNPPASPTGQDVEPFISMGEGSSNPSNPTDQSDIPPVPMIEPDYFTSPTSPRSQMTDMHHATSSGSRASRPRSKRNSRRKSVQHNGAIPVRPYVPMRNVLSENNLRLLNAMATASPPPPPVPEIPSSPSYARSKPPHLVRRRKYLASDDSSINSGNIPVPPIATAARRRSSQRSAQGRRYPSMDYFPLAQTTALGLKGGRIGLVQMGSPRKANKILGDVVLIVPEKEYVPGKRRRKSRRDVGPGMPRRGSIVQTMPARGSRAKVERLRGEKLPVGTFGEETDYMRRNREIVVEPNKPIVDTKYAGVESYIDRRPSADRRLSMEYRPSMEYRGSIEGRMSVEGRHNVESRASMDRRANVESRTSLERRATVESRASADYRMHVESRASIDRMRSVESRASIDRLRNVESRQSMDRLRNVESRTDLERKMTVESRTSIDRRRNVESRASTKHEMQVDSKPFVDRRTTVETIEPRPDVDSRASFEHKGTLELNRPKSKGAVWII